MEYDKKRNKSLKTQGRRIKLSCFHTWGNCLNIKKKQINIQTEEFNKIVQHYHLYVESEEWNQCIYLIKQK